MSRKRISRALVGLTIAVALFGFAPSLPQALDTFPAFASLPTIGVTVAMADNNGPGTDNAPGSDWGWGN